MVHGVIYVFVYNSRQTTFDFLSCNFIIDVNVLIKVRLVNIIGLLLFLPFFLSILYTHNNIDVDVLYV